MGEREKRSTFVSWDCHCPLDLFSWTCHVTQVPWESLIEKAHHVSLKTYSFSNWGKWFGNRKTAVSLVGSMRILSLSNGRIGRIRAAREDPEWVWIDIPVQGHQERREKHGSLGNVGSKDAEGLTLELRWRPLR